MNVHIFKQEPKNIVEYAFGIDIGFTNHIAAGICCYDTEGRMYFVYEY